VYETKRQTFQTTVVIQES